MKRHNFSFKEQVFLPLSYKDEKIGNCFLDFLIEDKIILEIKKDERFSRGHIKQVYSYLKSTGLKLGLIANFTKDGLKFKRVINIK